MNGGGYGDPQVQLEFACGPIPEPQAAELRFDPQVNWKLLTRGDEHVLLFRDHEGHIRQLGEFWAGFTRGRIAIWQNPRFPTTYFAPLSNPIDQVFMLNLLSQGHGAILHSLGLVHAGRGLIFAGPGGAGKTTTGRLWGALPDVIGLSDDRVIVRRRADGFYAFGTPWPGEGHLSSAASAPLKGLFLLRQAPYNRLTPLSPLQAISRLMRAALMPLWDAAAMQFTLALFEDLARTVPVYELAFTPDQGAVDCVLEALAA